MRITTASQKAISANAYGIGTERAILGVDSNDKTGSVNHTKSHAAQAGVTHGIGANQPLGTKGRIGTQNAHWSRKDKVTTRPSGWNLNFSVNVGNGLAVVTTTWASDDENSGKGNLAILKPRAVLTKAYSSLST